MVDFEKIRIFYHVCIEGSLLKTAKLIGTSSPAVSKHIADLEQKIGVKLFIRKKRGMILTAEGHKLFAVAKGAVSDLEKIALEMKGKEVTKDTIRIITTPGFVGYWTMQKLQPIFDKYSQIKFRIFTQEDEINFSESTADIGVLLKVEDPEHVSMKKVLTSKLYYYASPKYLARKGTPKNLDDLVNHDIISFYHSDHGFAGNVDWHLKVRNEIHIPRIIINNILVQFSAALQGVGLFACPSNFDLLGKFNFTPVLEEEMNLEVDVYMIYPADKLLEGILLEMYQCIIS